MEFKSYVKLSQEDLQAAKVSKKDLNNIIKTKAKIAPNVTVDMDGKRPRLTVFYTNGQRDVAYAGDYVLKSHDGTISTMSKKAFEASYAEADAK